MGFYHFLDAKFDSGLGGKILDLFCDLNFDICHLVKYG